MNAEQNYVLPYFRTWFKDTTSVLFEIFERDDEVVWLILHEKLVARIGMVRIAAIAVESPDEGGLGTESALKW